MEDRGFPTVRDVITKLKSDGTFDNFRKSCVNSIENEPLFRAQKEEVEVISRKFLQRGHWDDKSLKSDVRGHLRNYVLDILHRPEKNSQLSFIADKILSRKHKEFMAQINEVTNSLQDFAASNYRDENVSFGGTRKESVKATESAVDLLQSFAISTPSTVKKLSTTKSLKVTKPINNQLDSSIITTKEDSSAQTKDDENKEVQFKELEHSDDGDDEGRDQQTKELKLHKQHYNIDDSSSSSSEESDDNITSVPSLVTTDHKSYYDNSFTSLLHDKLYPGPSEEPEVKWSTRTPVTVPNVVKIISNCEQYSCFIHPAAPWHRCRTLHKQLSTKATDTMRNEVVSHCDKLITPDDEECTARQSGRLKKRKIEQVSSESETESHKTMSTDNPAANEQVIVNPTGTRTSKRVRRAPIKLRQ